MFSIPVQTAIVSSLVGNAVLAGIFLYLWRVDRNEHALGYWTSAYAASAGSVGFRMLSLAGYAQAAFGEGLLGAAVVVLLAMGARVFVGRAFEMPWRSGLLAFAAMGSVSGLAAFGLLPGVFPYLIAGAVFFLAGLAMLRRGREHPGVGYSIVGFLFALYGGYVFVFSDLASDPQDPSSYLYGPVINLAIGMVLLVVTQRKQHFEAQRLNAALLREAEGRRAAEAAGARNEQRYRAIVDTTRSMIGLLKPDGTVVDVNRTALERAGVQLQEVIGKPFWETPWWSHDPEQQQRLKEAVRRVAAGGHDRFESNHPGRHGSLDYFNFFLTPIRDDAGQVIYLVPEGHDITALKRTEHNLHAAEQRFRAISEGSMLGVFVTDPAGKTIYYSRRAFEITGVSEAELAGGRIAERLHPQDLGQHKTQWRDAIAERKPFAGERRHFRRDGSISWARLHVAPIMEGQELMGFVGTLEDITARKQTEQALRDSEERFSSFFALSPEPFAVARFPGGEYMQVNEAWERTFGFREAEVIGRTGLEIGLWEKPEDREKLYGDIVRRNEARSGEIRLRRKNGDFIVVQISARVVTLGQNKYILWGTHDVTERRRMQEALRASEERLARVFYLLPDLVTISSLEEGRFVDMNHHWESMMGYTRDEALGKPTAELGIWVHPEQRQRLVEDVMREGIVRNREITARRKDGTQLVCESSGSTFDWQGQRLLLLVTRDVTEQKALEQGRMEAEAKLRESEEKFSRFFELGPEPMVVARYEDAVCIDVNQAWLDKFGFSREEVIGHTPQELDFWLDTEERRKAIEVLGRTGEIDGQETWFMAKDGRRILAENLAKVFELSGARFVLWNVHDITEQRNAEIQLRVSEEKFSKAFHSNPDYMTISRLSDGTLLDCNDAFERFTGYARNEAINRSALDLGIWPYPEERARFTALLREQGWLRDFECTLHGRDRREMACLLTASTIEMRGEQCIIAVARDVSEQRRIERELRASEEKFSAIFHRSPVALGVTSIPEGRYLDVNEAWERQFRYSREQMLGKTSLDIGLWLDAAERQRLFDDLGAHSQVRDREAHFRRGDGAEILCELSGQVFELDGRKVLLWGAHDVTEHRHVQRQIEELNQQLEARVLERTARVEKANAELEGALESLKQAQHELVRTEKLAALGSLVAGVAHELNTPIGNSVTVASTLHDMTADFSRMLEAGKLRRSVLDGYVDNARTAADLLLSSLSQANELVSSFKQVAVDQASSQRRRFDLKLVIEEVTATLTPIIKKTPFRLHLELAGKVAMDSYPGPVGQVVTNLVMNSLTHAFEGRETGNMTLAARKRGQRQVEIVYADDGVGITGSDMQRIFDPFFTTKLGRGGSGLGLHIVYNLVTRVLGGRIKASSEVGGGTRFEITLPLKAPAAGEDEA
jgi:PAS domain S-box-containing protein